MDEIQEELALQQMALQAIVSALAERALAADPRFSIEVTEQLVQTTHGLPLDIAARINAIARVMTGEADREPT